MRGAITTFPDVYAGYRTERLLEAYAAGPDRVRGVIDGLDDAALRARPRPGKWSIVEIVRHVTDSELIGAARIRLTYSQTAAALPGYDQDLWAKALDYQGGDGVALGSALDLFTLLRRTTLAVLLRAQSEDWSRAAMHPEYGPVTLRNLLELYADHAERHIDQVLAIRRLLGVPLELPLLLEERLY